MYIVGIERRTIVEHWVRDLVDDFCGRVDLEAGPLLQGSPVDGFLLMLLKRECISLFSRYVRFNVLFELHL